MRLDYLSASADEQKSLMPSVIWMARSDGERPIKLLSSKYGSQLMGQRDSAKGDGFVRSG